MKSEIFNQDCMIGMKDFPDNYFDLAVIDPPYGFMKSDNLNFRYDKIYENIAPDADYFLELKRVSKNQIIWGANYFTPHLEPSLAWLCWDKGQPLDNFSDCELAWTSLDILTTVIRLDSYGFNHADKRHNGESTIHPTQKPVAIYQWIFKNYAKRGQKILDTHLGSGSSRIAAYNYKMDFTGYEIDKDYFEASEKRFQKHIAQLKIFN